MQITNDLSGFPNYPVWDRNRKGFTGPFARFLAKCSSFD